MEISTQDARAALKVIRKNSPHAKEIEQNADLLNLFVGIVNSSLAALDGKVAGALGLIDKHASIAGFAAKSEGAKGLLAASSALQISTQTFSLLKLGANATPIAVVATVGAVFTKKVSLAFGLAEDDKQAKLISVGADCASSLLAFGGTIIAGVSGPVGWVLLGAALAQVGASAYQAYTTTQQE